MWRFHQFPEIQNSIFIPGWTWIHDPSAPASSANPTGAYHHNRLNYAFLKSMFFSFKRGVGVGWGGWGGVPECLFPLYCFRPVIDFKPEPGVLSKGNKHDRERPSGSSSLITSCWEAYRSHCGVLSFAYHRTLLGSVRMRHTYVWRRHAQEQTFENSIRSSSKLLGAMPTERPNRACGCSVLRESIQLLRSESVMITGWLRLSSVNGSSFIMAWKTLGCFQVSKVIVQAKGSASEGSGTILLHRLSFAYCVPYTHISPFTIPTASHILLWR